jgi:plasmid rolling circle replication initiator protein Rep
MSNNIVVPLEYQEKLSELAFYKKRQKLIIPRFAFDTKIQSRVADCGDVAFFNTYQNISTYEIQKRLSQSYMCANRFCDVCNKYRARKVGTQIYNQFKALEADGKEFLFLTLTVPNIKPDELKFTIQNMAKAWHKFIRLEAFKPFHHWVRTLEITCKGGNTLHPHYHCMLAVDKSYFKSDKYLHTREIASLWGRCLDIDLERNPICDIRKVKPNLKKGKGSLLSSIAELSKYPLKTTDLSKLNDDDFELVFKQLKRLRFVSTSRNLKLNEKIDKNDLDDLKNDDIWNLLCIEIFKFRFDSYEYLKKLYFGERKFYPHENDPTYKKLKAIAEKNPQLKRLMLTQKEKPTVGK